MTSRLEWIGNNVVIYYSDNITLADVENINNTIVADPRFDEQRFQYNIFKPESYLDMSELEFQKMLYTEKASTQINRHKIYHTLVLKTLDNDLLESCIQYQAFVQNQGWEAQIFSNTEDASLWLLQYVSLTMDEEKTLQNLTQK